MNRLSYLFPVDLDSNSTGKDAIAYLQVGKDWLAPVFTFQKAYAAGKTVPIKKLRVVSAEFFLPIVSIVREQFSDKCARRGCFSIRFRGKWRRRRCGR